MLLVARKKLDYGQKPYAAGEKFTATEQHAAVLIALGYASQVLPERVKRQYRRRDMQAQG